MIRVTSLPGGYYGPGTGRMEFAAVAYGGPYRGCRMSVRRDGDLTADNYLLLPRPGIDGEQAVYRLNWIAERWEWCGGMDAQLAANPNDWLDDDERWCVSPWLWTRR